MNKLWIIICLLCIAGFSHAQELRGKILSATDSLPLPGVSISMNNKVETTTNASGGFKLNLKNGANVITIRSVGFRDTTITVQIPVSNVLMVYLHVATNNLDEVVINTGYQTLPKERATGSFVTLSNKQLNEQISPDILGRIEAIGNGVTVDRRGNSRDRLMVRGLSTISGPRDPLIILDNFPYQGDLSNINPNDIENITILKDAAAASIWGSKAGNGVIVLTSKKASAGQDLKISFNSNYTTGPKPDLFSKRMISSASMIEVEQMLFDKGYYNSKITSSSKPPLSPVVEMLAANRNGTLSSGDLNQQLSVLRGIDVRRELLDKSYNNPINRQYALNLSGSSKSNTWTLSAGYDNNVSALDATSTRLTLNSQNSIKLIKNVQLDVGIRLTEANVSGGKVGIDGLGIGTGATIYPYLQLAAADGTPLPIARSYSQSYLNTLAATGQLMDWNYYPLAEHLHNNSKIATRDFTTNIGLNYTFLKDFKASIRYQNEREVVRNKMLFDNESFTARSAVNNYTQIDATGKMTYKVPKGGVLDNTESIFKIQNLRGQLDYNKQWNAHQIAVIAGGELNDASFEEQGSRVYGYDNETLAYVPVDYTVAYPMYVTHSNSFIEDGPTGFGSTVKRFVSVFANGAYTFKNRYTVSGSLRQDASNLYGVKTNEKWKPLWSTGFSWLLSDEPFYKVPWLPYLKLRATYGFAGNIDQSKTAVTTISAFQVSKYTNLATSIFNEFVNPELRWEKVGTINLGADFSMLNNRIKGSIEVYRKTATDLYGISSTDYTAVPSDNLIRNIASIRAEGLDVGLNIHSIKGRINLYTDINFNLYRDKVLNYNLVSMQGSAFVGNGNLGAKGYPVNGIYSYRWAGLDAANGNPQGYFEGNLSEDYSKLTGAATQFGDMVFNGSAIPTTFGSIGNTVEYKQISLTVRATYKFGYWFRRASLSYSNLYRLNGDPDYDLRWKFPGDETHTQIPSLVYPYDTNRDNFYNYSDLLVERGDHIRLDYISLGYTLNRIQAKKLPVNAIKIQFNISNLGLLWKANKTGIDPSYNGNIAPSRNYSIGLRCTL